MMNSIFKKIGELFSPSIFEISIKDGKAILAKGNVLMEFVQDCSDIANQNKLSEGAITGVKGKYGIELRFSDNIPEPVRQRFRNVWGYHKS